MTTSITLGRLEKVSLREVWASEASDFTPWLASNENISLLGEAIGLDLQVESTERAVGPFSADILCRDASSPEEHWVLIENQLERTDHTHLGQLLTYAAGLKVVTIVWISQRFTDEHRAALDWLNEITDERFRFFGLEVEAWRIGNSLAAPKFNLVSRPNDWSRKVTSEAVRAASEPSTPTKKLQLDFWQGFVSYAATHAKRISPHKPAPQTWLNMSLGRTNFWLTAIVSTWDSSKGSFDNGEIRAEMRFKVQTPDAVIQTLRIDEAAITSELGEPLVWPEDGRSTQQRRVYLRRAVDLDDRDAWPNYFDWLVTRLDRMHATFQPRVKKLDLDELASEAEDVSGE